MVMGPKSALEMEHKGTLLLFSDKWEMDESINLLDSFSAAGLSN